MEIGMVRESRNAEVAVYDGSIPRGETLVEKALGDYLHGTPWNVKRCTIVGEPKRYGGQWCVDVTHMEPQRKGEAKLVTTIVPTRSILCPWEHFEQIAKARKDELRNWRKVQEDREVARRARFETIEAALAAKGVTVDNVCGEKLTLTFAHVEALLGIGK